MKCDMGIKSSGVPVVGDDYSHHIIWRMG